MPPKKVNKTVKKAVQAKTPRRRVKREKTLPRLKAEENINLSQLNSTSAINYDKNKERIVNLTKNDINIMLANEVVERQFPKKSPLLKDPNNEVVLDVLKQTKRKPVLKRKQSLKHNVLSNEETDTCRGKSVEKNVTRRILQRNFRSSLITVQNEYIRNTDDRLPREPCRNKTKKFKRNKAVPKQDLVGNVASVQESVEITKPKTPRRNVSLNTKTATGGPRTRKKANEATKVTQTEIKPENVTRQKESSNNVDASKASNVQDIILRKNSLTSMSELSWTKDISSSSTTTCATVSSNDFFLIDNKIPIIKLTNIDRNIKSEENNNIHDKKCPKQIIEIQFDNILCEKNANDNCEKTNDNIFQDEIDVPYTQFISNLSSSSSESCSDLDKSGQSVSTAVNKVNDTLEKLSSRLKNFDLEIINWIGYTNENANPNVEIIQEKLYQNNFLKEEMNVIVQCKNIKRILSGNNQITDPGEISGDKVQNTCDNITDKENLNQSHNINNDERNIYKENDSQEESNDIEQISSPVEEKNIAVNKSIDNTSFDDDDEDDALSLFAESITGIESSTRNSKVDGNAIYPNLEEYVPQPIMNNTTKSPETVVYRPTKINKTATIERPKEDGLGNVCEKQSADSTSVYKEQDNDNSLEVNDIFYEDRLGDVPEVSRKRDSFTKLIQKTPILMNAIYKPITGGTSILFKGICFYNLISKCKKNTCKFPHVSPDVEEVNNKLSVLSDTTFIQEYMLLRCWPGLRWKYGMCFVEECIRRNLTRIIVEVALDFITKVTNKLALTNVVETILLYLNNVDLSVCEDLLKINVQTKPCLLCDFFINTIAESQNFSRFKCVFINLTEFMYLIGRRFSEDVAAQILERVVILPYDERLARALIKIIRNTSTSIFSNSMIGHFEQQLLSSNIEIYEEFRSLKMLKNQTILGNCYKNSTLHNDMDRSNTNLNNLDKDKRYSPDTTHLDGLSKTTIEPQFTRIIDLNKLNFLNLNNRMSNSSSLESCEDKRFAPRKQFKNCRGRKSYDNKINMSRNTTMRPPLRPPFKRRSDQALGGGPSKFQRRNGFNFF